MHIIEFPVVPCTTPIYNGFNHDGVVDIHGELLQGPQNGFVVEFPSREGIAFHVSIRAGYGSENVVVLNNMRSGGWQMEQRQSNVFHFGHHFHLQIKCHSSHFAIYVNGQHFAHFNHREDPFHITGLTIRGDVRVEKIHFEHFSGMNGGGVQAGTTFMTSGPNVVMAPAPAPTVVIEQRPAPLVEVVVPPRRPIIEVVAPRRPIVVVAPPRRPILPPVVVVKEGHHHHHNKHH
ncbi:unnamed protein product [Cylicocyclus nassatus]|uniref:Galectin n=1 Tax=Cylicocyclus nassatus TaxID=53992 RepID=A0AA36H2H1_CYLNA|nr:unnamed protein product [Cylicocyclus nassatus]